MEQNKQTPFRQALLDATLESYADLPAEDQIQAEFSHRFLQKSRDLLKKPRWTGKTLRRILLVAAIISALVAMAVAGTAQRTYLFQYTITEYSRYYEFKYTDAVPADTPNHLEVVYKPAYIPEGFTLQWAVGNETAASFDWRNDQGLIITYQQGLIKADDIFLKLHKNTEGPTTIDGVMIGKYDVLRVFADMGTMYFWTDGEYLHYMGFSPEIPEAECIKIFQSLAVDENPELAPP